MYHYAITPYPNRHQWHITLSYTHNGKHPNQLKLANWVAGSYMIRDFSRHIISIQAACNKQIVPIQQLNKNTWQLPEQTGQYQIHYIVYANDLSVRASLLDNERGFIDGACLFLYQPQQKYQAAQISFQQLPEHWQIHTTLPQIAPNTFQAANHAKLVDSPIEIGADLEVLHFTAANIPHQIVLSGHYPQFDRQRLIADCQKICTYQLNLFPRPAPFSQYQFLLHLGDNIYGGLEHRSSTALHADRHSLPQPHMTEATPDYLTLLGLISHEYFHAWNVKSVKPTQFQPYDSDQETYTEQLWAYEGITSYYDDLSLVRSRVISVATYLNLLAQNITKVWRTTGRKHQTLAQSSFTAWNKYYKQDENAPNAIASYYQQGALAALCLDLHIRAQSQHSLDTIMQQLYQRYLNTGLGTAEHQWQQLAQQYTQLNLHPFFQATLYSTEDLPLQSSLKTAGLALTWQPENQQSQGALVGQPPNNPPQAELGCRHKPCPQGTMLTHFFNDSAAEEAGLKAGDIIIAINHFACTNFIAQTQTQIGDQHTIHYLRQGYLHQTQLSPKAAAATTAYLTIENEALLLKWLFG